MCKCGEKRQRTVGFYENVSYTLHMTPPCFPKICLGKLKLERPLSARKLSVSVGKVSFNTNSSAEYCA